MNAAVLGEAATHLPWIAPCAASLVTLARSADPSAWDELRLDPGAVLLLASCNTAGTPPGPALFCHALHEPAVLERALWQLERGGPDAIDWSASSIQPIYEASLFYARLAYDIALSVNDCDADCAWAGGLLAPLGWIAICALDAPAAAACLADPKLTIDPVAVQRQRWGFEHASIARRLARRWRLPRWLEVIVGHLELPANVATTLGGDARLSAVVQLAVTLAEDKSLQLRPGSSRDESAALLGLTPSNLEGIVSEARAAVGEIGRRDWTSPRSLPLLRDLLWLGIDNRRLSNAPVLEQVEAEDDALQQALREQHAQEEERLQARKLTALAEFAAGAGHEINNPLAVISGQAQYVLHHETDPGKQRALQAIVGQAQRIHQILGDLMQYARPPHPAPQPVEALALVREVVGGLRELAEHRRVQVAAPPPHQLASIYADPRHIQTALVCLLRNGIEAAPPEGWASIRFEVITGERVEFVVEDNGPSLDAVQREHAFDPFFSGRQAGRGRGLGLPTAWRLARENGGDVRFEDTQGGPTRFVLSLPVAPATNGTSTNGQHHPSDTVRVITNAE